MRVQKSEALLNSGIFFARLPQKSDRSSPSVFRNFGGCQSLLNSITPNLEGGGPKSDLNCVSPGLIVI